MGFPSEVMAKPSIMAILENVARNDRPRLVAFRNRRGDLVDVPEVSATAAKNEFGRILETAIAEGAVAITRHNLPRAVLLSVEEFNALAKGRPDELNTLSEEFDAMLDRMQTPAAGRALRRGFDASPAELGEAAVRAAKKKRRG